MPKRPPRLGTAAKAPRGWAATSKKSKQARGYGAEWGRLRIIVLKRDKYLCQPCLRLGRVTRATEVDHIVPKHLGGTDDPANLQSICNPCHKAKTARERGKPGQ